jgi:hypothetical protein
VGIYQHPENCRRITYEKQETINERYCRRGDETVAVS